MPVIVKGSNGGGDFTPAPEGVHRAICYAIVDLGTQPSKDYGPARKVLFLWELVDELMSDGRPFSVNARYTMSLHEKATLRKVLESWRGKKFTDAELRGFDLENVLEKPCQVQVIHNKSGDKVYANVSNVMPINKAMAPSGGPQNDAWSFSLPGPGGTPDFPSSMPDWIKNKILESEEMRGIADDGAKDPVPAYTTAPAATDDDEDIPF